ncbi:hypothetical protein SLA2020_179210 [Shorea laevis]
MASLAALSESFSHFYTITLALIIILILQLVTLIRSVTGYHSQDPITLAQYLKYIEDNNPTILFSKKSTLEPNECTVCLSEIKEGENVRKLKCKHTFHRDCLDQWLQQYRATCPLCRTKVLPERIVAEFYRQQHEVEYDEEIVRAISAFYRSDGIRLF